MAYNLFRIAAILQGIAKRVEAGTASSAQAAASGAGARPMAETGLALRAAGLTAASSPALPQGRHMDFDYSPKTKELQAKLLKFMDDHIYPTEKTYEEELAGQHRGGQALDARCRPSRSSSPRRAPPACGTCSCRWTAPPPRATKARA